MSLVRQSNLNSQVLTLNDGLLLNVGLEILLIEISALDDRFSSFLYFFLIFPGCGVYLLTVIVLIRDFYLDLLLFRGALRLRFDFLIGDG